MSLTNSLATLASTPPPAPIAARRQALADTCAQIAILEAKLGQPHGLPTLSLSRATARLTELQKLAKTTTPPAAAAPAAPAAAAALPFESSGSDLVDAAMRKAGARNLSEFKAQNRKGALFGAACQATPGSVTKRCLVTNLGK